MKKRTFIFSFFFPSLTCFLLTLHLIGQTSKAETDKISKKIQTILETLPEKKITLDFFFKKSIESSNELKMLLSQKISADSSYLKSKASLQMDYQLSSSFSFLNDQGEGLTIIQPESQKVPSYSLSLSKSFSSGTKFSGQWNYRFLDTKQKRIDTFFNGNSEKSTFSLLQPPDSYYQSDFSLTLSQNLLQDLIRKSKKKYLKANQIKKDVIQFEIHEKIERLFLNLTHLFYKAWILQKKIKASKENSKKQRRLLKITQIKKKRGTEFESNLLLIEAHLIQIEQQEKSTEQELKALWIHTIKTLNLPEAFIQLDPYRLPMKIKQERKKAIQLCESPILHMNSIFNKNPEIQKIQQELKSKELLASYWKDQMLPDLSLNFKLSSNGYDEKTSPLLKEVFEFDHPSWSVGVNFKMNLFNFKQKAALSESIERKTFLTLQLEKKKQDLKVNWLNLCENLKITSNQIKNYQKVYEIQRKRSQLEEKRFQIGRTSAFNVIQAEKDATNSESMLYKSIHDAEILSWKIYQIYGHLLDAILSQLK